MKDTTFYIILVLIALVFLYIYTCTNADEVFIIPQNIVDPGDLDYGIEPPGAIADQGSFTTDMQKYMSGEGEGNI